MNDPRLKKTKIGFFEVVEKPTQDELNAYYANKYYQDGVGSYEITYDDKEIKYINQKIKQRHHVLNKFIETTQGRFLDVGCGEGFALKYFYDLGWNVKGIDYSEAGLKQQNPEMLENVDVGDIYKFLSKYRKNKKQYDVIWLNNVLEHVLDPISLLNDLKNLISREGVLVVTVPNDSSDLQEYCFKNDLIPDRFWIALPDHMSYFSYDSLQSLAKHTGWECRDIIADFPIDLYLLHSGSNYIADKSCGPHAHRARIEAELLISNRDIDNVIKFYKSMAQIGLGRDLTAFFKPA